MRLRWLFHRLMLDQSLSFYANEFAGRVTTKIMQTALAVRDALFMSVDVVIGVAAYLIGILALAASFDWRLMIPLALGARLRPGVRVFRAAPRCRRQPPMRAR